MVETATNGSGVDEKPGRKFAPMGRTFGLLYGAITLILVAFVASGAWFASSIQGVGHAIDLAGSERMRVFQVALLVERSLGAEPSQRELILGHVAMEAVRFEEILDALKDGSPKYRLGDFSEEEADAKLVEVAETWREVIKPALHAVGTAAPEERRRILDAFSARLHDFAERDINEVVTALATQQEEATRVFVSLRSVLTVLGVIALGLGLVYVRRKILGPIRSLLEDSEAIAAGDYSVRSELGVANELGLLGERFRKMGEAVAASIARLEATVRERTRDLQLSSARMQALIDSAPDAILAMNASDRTLTLFSRGAEEMFGYPAAEVLGKNVSLLMPEPYHSAHDGYVANYLTTGTRKIIGTIRVVKGRKKDGTEFDIDLSVSESLTESGRVFNAIIRDISARVQAEQAVEAKNRELEGAARIDRIGARVMVALNHSEGARLAAAAEVLRVLADEAGYRPLALYEYDEWQGGLALAAGLGLSAADERKRFRIGEGLVGEAAGLRQAMFIERTGDGPLVLDTGIGVLGVATLFALPLIHREKLLGVIAGASRTPILERERSGLIRLAAQVAVGLHALHQFQELKELSSLLNQRSRKIEAQNRELAQANRLKSEFLASMSHELRTPLNAIIGFSEVLKDGLLGELPAPQLDYVTEVFQSGRHLLSLINDILDLSKIESGKMTLDIESVDIASLVGNALTIVKDRAARGGVSVTHWIAPELTSIEADGRKLRQIVYNLLSNAVKFTLSGGTVRLEVSAHGPVVEFSVVDSGIGIAPADHHRLFRSFEQLDGGIDRKFEGTGLGLAMVKSLVALHGGTLGVESQPGKGSRFWVRLPRLRTGGREEPRFPTPLPGVVVRRDADSTAPRVLVIDDDRAALDLARHWLSKEGYAVELATDCDEAQAMLEERAPDAIMLDLHFVQGPGGWEFLAKLKDSPAFGTIPVVIVSIVADRPRGLALGAVEVLQKPVAGVELIRAIGSLGLAPNSGAEALSILVVDDDPRAVEHVALRLEQAGMLVTRAYGGADALASLADGEFSAIVLDLMMPDVSGFEVLRELRSNAATVDLPVIVLTAKVLDPGERAALERSVDTVLSKGDWDERRFLQLVRGAVLARGRIGRAIRTPPRPTGAPTPRRPPALAGKPRKQILVIDDDCTTRDLLCLYLEDAGFAVTIAESDVEAIGRIETSPPDLVTLGLAGPGTAGRAFLRAHARLAEPRPNVPVLVVSGAADSESALAVCEHAVLPEPIRRRGLLEAVGRLIDKASHRPPYVMVVDDDPKAVQVVSDYLSEEGVDLACVHGARHALASIGARRPDLLILDLMMPEMSGFELLAELRSGEETLDLPVIILSARTFTAADRAVLDTGAQATLSKGTTARDELIACVRRLLGRGGFTGGEGGGR